MNVDGDSRHVCRMDEAFRIMKYRSCSVRESFGCTLSYLLTFEAALFWIVSLNDDGMQY